MLPEAEVLDIYTRGFTAGYEGKRTRRPKVHYPKLWSAGYTAGADARRRTVRHVWADEFVKLPLQWRKVYPEGVTWWGLRALPTQNRNLLYWLLDADESDGGSAEHRYRARVILAECWGEIPW